MMDYEQPNIDAMTIHQVLQSRTKEEILERLQRKNDLHCIGENGDTVLHAILKNGRLMERDVVEILTIFLTRGVGSSIVNNDGETTLHLAVDRRMKNVVNLLLEFLYYIHTVDERGNSVAHFFIEDEYEKCKIAMRYPLMNTEENREMRENDSVNFLKFLMSKGVDFNRENKQGESALHLAAKYQLLHIIPTLLEYTNDVMFVDKNDKTLLHLLLEGKSRLPDEHRRSGYTSKNLVRCVKFLLDRGVPLLDSERSGCTLVSNAIKEKEEMDIIETLINYYLHSCDDKAAATTLFYELASTCALWSDSETDYFLTVLRDLVFKGIAINNESPQNRLWLTDNDVKILPVVEFLKEYGIAYSVRLSHGKNLLHMLAEQELYEGSSGELYSHICNLVFGGDCEVNVADDRGETALQMAVANNNVPMVRALIELGADVNHRDDAMRTPLHDAKMTSESVEMIELLLSNGADLKAKDHAGETPLHSAVAHENLAIASLLLERGASVNCDSKCQPLHRVRWAKDGAADMIELLLSRGADMNAKDHAGETPLHMAAFHGNVALVRLLLERGASVNCKDACQQTPLYRACCRAAEAVGIVRLLLTSGADANAKNYKSGTSLLEAISRNHSSIVRLLVEHGASVDCRDRNRRTPLHRALAIDAGVEIVRLLLARGANVNAKDFNGDRPLHVLFKRWESDDCKPILKLLMERGAYVNARNDQGESALFHALSGQNSTAIDELLRYGADLNDSNVRGMILSYLHQPHRPFLQQYLLKFKFAKLPGFEEYGSNFTNDVGDHAYFKACTMDVEKLKSTSIGNGKSLHDFLRVNLECRRAYVNCEVVQRLVKSSELDEQFPMYSDVILAKYHEVVSKKSLIEEALEAFYELVQVLSRDSINQILAHLTDADLINIVETSDHDSVAE